MPMDPTRGSAPVWTGMVDVGAVTQPIPGAPRSALSILVALGIPVSLSILVALGIPVILCILVALRIPVSQCSPAALDTSVALWCWWPWVHPAPGQALLEPGTEGPNGQLHPFPPQFPGFLCLSQDSDLSDSSAITSSQRPWPWSNAGKTKPLQRASRDGSSSLKLQLLHRMERLKSPRSARGFG